MHHARMNPLFTATVEAVHEAIINAMCMATTTRGIRGRYAHAIPLDRLRDILREYKRLSARYSLLIRHGIRCGLVTMTVIRTCMSL